MDFLNPMLLMMASVIEIVGKNVNVFYLVHARLNVCMQPILLFATYFL